MEVHFSPDQIAQLAQIAAQEGVDTQKLVKDAALKLLQDDEHFRASLLMRMPWIAAAAAAADLDRS